MVPLQLTSSAISFRYFWIGTGALGISTVLAFNVLKAESQVEPGVWKPDLPTYNSEEVSKHVSKARGIWVTYKDGVYDVTNFPKKYPGPKNIMMAAAGGSVEPFWNVYPVHKSQETYKLLEEFRIGNINEKNVEVC